MVITIKNPPMNLKNPSTILKRMIQSKSKNNLTDSDPHYNIISELKKSNKEKDDKIQFLLLDIFLLENYIKP